MAGASTFLKSKNVIFVKGSCSFPSPVTVCLCPLVSLKPQGGQKDRVPLGKPFLNQTLERERLWGPLHPHREGTEAAEPSCPSCSSESLVQASGPGGHIRLLEGPEQIVAVGGTQGRHCFSSIHTRPPDPPKAPPRALSLCHRRHSRKSSSATLHSSPVRNLLLSHSGSIFSNSKIVLALWGQKPA